MTQQNFGSVTNMGYGKSQTVASAGYTLVPNVIQNLDFKPQVNLNLIDRFQGVFIDNSQGTDTLVLYVPSTFQTIYVPAGYLAIMPIYVTADMTFQLSGNNDNAIVIFNNFPTPACVWKAAA